MDSVVNKQLRNIKLSFLSYYLFLKISLIHLSFVSYNNWQMVRFKRLAMLRQFLKQCIKIYLVYKSQNKSIHLSHDSDLNLGSETGSFLPASYHGTIK